MKNPLTLKAWLILALILLVCFGLLGWRAGCKAAETAKDNATMADARTSSAIEAIDAIGDNAAANSATQAQVEDAQDAVNRETDPVVRDAVARRELCKLQRPDGPC